MSAEEELHELQQRLQQFTASVAPRDDLRQFLKLSRDARVPNAELVARYGTQLLSHYRRGLSEEEVWLLHEQVATAALEVGATGLAAELIRAVLRRFPKESMRAKRLQGMFYEAQGNPEKAEGFYHEIIKEQPSNQTISKRLVACCRTKGDLPGAVEYLRTYLDYWMNDRSAWEELADLYLEVGLPQQPLLHPGGSVEAGVMGLYRQAAYCLEELITMAPGEPNLHVRYADALLTLGGAPNARTARAYYAKAVQLTRGRSARALYGLAAAAAALQGQAGQSDAGAKPEAQELPQAAGEALVRLYREQAPGKVPLVEALLRRQGVLV
ncbi:TPR repeat protein oca3 [Monoraphidium neglectum]|uniref:ER membrane protein complex subunit 2 n=1 Tax=Monoraphidium neglectum TaxID=145388 RepID=A0A0D2ME13_9CHLO|nr:TPR repeat protein oca3 [Monoraphidium neglectum]KIY98996.1 TPR repeat protein oca3 [Monoraphidium neglectum]|eukprot:XP_013898016.1 TPR repeat protein oca3 [Monoraphidium neglectum]